MFGPAADGGVGCFSRMPFVMWVLHGVRACQPGGRLPMPRNCAPTGSVLSSSVPFRVCREVGKVDAKHIKVRRDPNAGGGV